MNRKNTRLELTDTPMSAVLKFSNGNPGAMSATVAMMRDTPLHDPDNAFGGFSVLMSLDNLGIYESDIWVLYKDVCGHDTLKCAILFRANQLGFLTTAQIKKAASPTAFDFVDLLGQIQEQVPCFGRVAQETT